MSEHPYAFEEYERDVAAAEAEHLYDDGRPTRAECDRDEHGQPFDPISDDVAYQQECDAWFEYQQEKAGLFDADIEVES